MKEGPGCSTHRADGGASTRRPTHCTNDRSGCRADSSSYGGVRGYLFPGIIGRSMFFGELAALSNVFLSVFLPYLVQILVWIQDRSRTAAGREKKYHHQG